MNKKNEVAKKANPSTDLKSPRAKQPQPKKDPRDPIQYLTDKTFEAAGKGLNRLEQEKPGTCRKLAGIASLGAGATGIGAGVYLLIT